MAKYLELNTTSGNPREVQAATTGGATDANKMPQLDASGRLKTAMMPTGIGADTAVVEANGALSAGDFVNIYNDGGTAKARKADATTSAAPAIGFVLEAVADAAQATVYLDGTNNALSGLTPGPLFLSTTAGIAASSPPTGSGVISQRIGFAVSATAMAFERGEPIEQVA